MLKKRFFSPADAEGLLLKKDTENEVILYKEQDSLNGEWKEYKNTFKDYYRKCIIEQYNFSRKLIADHIYNCQNQSCITTFIRLILDHLAYLKDVIERNPETSRYEINSKILKSLNNYVRTKYRSFIHDEAENLPLLADEGTLKKAEFPKFRLTGKQWQIQTKAGDLHNSLMKNGYLEKDSKLDFEKLFTGHNPSKKILWTGNKGELKSFIDLLFSRKKVEIGQNRKWMITAQKFYASLSIL